jgi:hypothetical protein
MTLFDWELKQFLVLAILKSALPSHEPLEAIIKYLTKAI